MSISLCMITKNEEKFIGQAINSVKSIVDEVIVVDTGSTDKTREIVIRLGAKVFYKDWTNDFSDARNFSISKATKDWILVLDADEIIAQDDLEKLKELTTSNAGAFSFVQRNYSNKVNDARFIPIKETPASKDYKGYLKAVVTRLFKNDKRIKFTGKVHESVNESITEINGKIVESNIPIHHYFEEKGKENLKQRQLMYLDISKEKLKTNPNDPKTHCDIGIISWEFNKDSKTAIHHFEKAIEFAKDYENAYLGLGAVYAEQGELKKAVEVYKRLIDTKPMCYNAYHNLAEIFAAIGMLEDAIREYKRCLKLNLRDEKNIKAKIKALENQVGGLSYDFNAGVG